MSIRSIATVVALAGSFIAPLAFAKHAPSPTSSLLQSSSPAAQSKTRAQVIQEVLQAQRDGSFAKTRGEASYVPEFQQTYRSLLTRDQVNNQVLRAQRDGSLARSRGEAPSVPEFQATRGLLTRAEVRQDALQARHDGVLDKMRGEAGDTASAYASAANR